MPTGKDVRVTHPVVQDAWIRLEVPFKRLPRRRREPGTGARWPHMVIVVMMEGTSIPRDKGAADVFFFEQGQLRSQDMGYR